MRNAVKALTAVKDMEGTMRWRLASCEDSSSTVWKKVGMLYMTLIVVRESALHAAIRIASQIYMEVRLTT